MKRSDYLIMNRRPRELNQQCIDDINQAFDVFNTKNRDGLDYYELRAAMRALGFEPSKQQVQEILGHTGARYIKKQKFVETMTKLIQERDPKDEFRRAFELMDVNHRGKIGFAELKQAAQDISENLDDDELRAMIEVFDLDEDGAISLQEFISICSDE